MIDETKLAEAIAAAFLAGIEDSGSANFADPESEVSKWSAREYWKEYRDAIIESISIDPLPRRRSW